MTPNFLLIASSARLRLGITSDCDPQSVVAERRICRTSPQIAALRNYKFSLEISLNRFERQSGLTAHDRLLQPQTKIRGAFAARFLLHNPVGLKPQMIPNLFAFTTGPAIGLGCRLAGVENPEVA
jgi:hypothetical protein